MVEKHASFSKPTYFDDRLSEIKRKIAQLKAKTQQSNVFANNRNNTQTQY